MKLFAQLGAELDKAWRARNFDHAAFPDLAVAALRDLPPAGHVTPGDVARWVCTSDALVAQRNLGSPFGSPPVTVFANGRFYIDVLFWLDGTTTIHEHGFCGAFHVLAGSSVESRYRFTRADRIGDHVQTGELALAAVEHLRHGDTRAIHPGSALIHSLFHLDRPSVSVVVRTAGHPSVGPQLNYCRRSGIAYDPFFRSEQTTCTLQVLDMLGKVDDPGRFDVASAALADQDALSTLLVLDALAARSADDPRFAALLAGLPQRHGALLERFPAYVEERTRERNIATRRQLITRPEHRFLLALLLTVPSRRDLLRIVGAAHEGAPADTITTWIEELAAMKAPGTDEPNVLGIHLDDTSLRVVRHLLDGVSDGQLLERLAGDFDAVQVAEQRDELLQLCRGFRAHSLFAPLFLS